MTVILFAPDPHPTPTLDFPRAIRPGGLFVYTPPSGKRAKPSKERK